MYEIVKGAKPMFASKEEADKFFEEFRKAVDPELKKCDERRRQSESSPRLIKGWKYLMK